MCGKFFKKIAFIPALCFSVRSLWLKIIGLNSHAPDFIFVALCVNFVPFVLKTHRQNFKCFTVKPLFINCFNDSMPICRWVSTYCSVTFESLSLVFTPSGIMG